jgi:uncharacterized protein YbaR (Trm112 family)
MPEVCDIEQLKDIITCPLCGSKRIDFDHDDQLKQMNQKSCDICNCIFTIIDGEVKIL